MTPKQLIEQCEKSINSPVFGGENAKVSLVLKGRFTKSGRKALWKGKGAPIGQCLSEVSDGQILVLFSAKEVMEAVKREEDKKCIPII